ncbi:MAG: hypothetical protein ABI811_14750 [Acidobacteriota bacterium]
MARNEDGEFELMLGNRQLLSVFFLMVLLLGLCFTGGYMLGRKVPVLTATNSGPIDVPNTTPASPPPAAEPVKEPVKEPPPVKTAPQTTVETAAVTEPPKPAPEKEKVVAKIEPPAAIPEKAKQPPPQAKQAPLPPAKTVLPPVAAKQPAVAAKQPPIASRPVPGRVYLQLTATDQVKAETIADLLRSKSFPGVAAPIPEKPGMFRVLVGPLAESALADTKTQLKAAGFPADGAFKQVFR